MLLHVGVDGNNIFIVVKSKVNTSNSEIIETEKIGGNRSILHKAMLHFRYDE